MFGKWPLSGERWSCLHVWSYLHICHLLNKKVRNNLTIDVVTIIIKTAFVKAFTYPSSCPEMSTKEYKNGWKNKIVITLSTNFALAWFCFMQSFDWVPLLKIISLCTWDFIRVDDCVCAYIYACLKILPTAEVCGGCSGMKTSSWEGNLNVMLNTFKNIIQMMEEFSFMTFGTVGNQQQKFTFLVSWRAGLKCRYIYSILRGLKAARPILGLTLRM